MPLVSARLCAETSMHAQMRGCMHAPMHASRLASAFPTARLRGVIVHRLEDTPFCFASFGMQEIGKKRSEMKPKSLQNHLRGSSGETLGALWAASGPQVRKRSKKRDEKHQKLLPFWTCFSYFCPKWREQVFSEFPGGPQTPFLRILVAKSIKKEVKTEHF